MAEVPILHIKTGLATRFFQHPLVPLSSQVLPALPPEALPYINQAFWLPAPFWNFDLLTSAPGSPLSLSLCPSPSPHMAQLSTLDSPCACLYLPMYG